MYSGIVCTTTKYDEFIFYYFKNRFSSSLSLFNKKIMRKAFSNGNKILLDVENENVQLWKSMHVIEIQLYLYCSKTSSRFDIHLFSFGLLNIFLLHKPSWQGIFLISFGMQLQLDC